MKRLVTLAALALGIRAALAADASVALYVFDQQQPLAGAEVLVDGQARATTDRDGAARLVLAPGSRRIVVLRDGTEVLTLELDAREDEQGEIIATLYPDSAPSVFVESSHGESGQVAGAAPAGDLGPPGLLEGRIVGSEDGQPIEGARIYVSGTPLDIRSDAEGRFRVELPPGSYAISVIAADFATQTVDDIAVASEQPTIRDVELTPAGLELPEFVVLEPFVEGSLAAFVEERRASSAVTDVLGAEQISRQGDSDAAGALKRVTGLTLVDGKYVYVRGLGERYSSVLLNGAQIPSPDPTRRVVPLDLFPTDVLSGVVIQKTYSAEMPGEFGGGTIQLRTKSYPDELLVKFGFSGGYVDGATFEDGLGYEGGDRDWTGFDDGSRALPDSLAEATAGGQFIRPASTFNPDGFSAEQIEGFGEDLATLGYDVRPEQIDPNFGFSASVGNSFGLGQDGRWGFLGAVRYANAGDFTEEDRRTYSSTNQGLELNEQFDVRRTTRNVDLSGFLNVGAELGDDHRIAATSMFLHQAEDEVSVSEGESDSQQLQRFRLRWIESELVSNQLTGEHALPLANLGLSWQYTAARADRYEPNTREYRRDLINGEYLFSNRADNNSQSFARLIDNADNWSVDLELPFALGEDSSLKFFGGVNEVSRDRDASLRTFKFGGGGPFLTPDLRRESIEQIFVPDNIGRGLFTLQDSTRATDNYVADQELSARYLSADLNLFDTWRFTAGYREEDNRQTVLTNDLTNPQAPPVVGEIDQTDYLPSLAMTWWHSDDAQLRLGYGRSVSRPDFRELSAAPFLDPLLDIITVGNPDLVSTVIDNIDLRWEYYFSPTESFSVGAFYKDFANPIEKTLSSGGSTSILTLRNALGAEVYGIEFDVYKQLSFIGRWSWVQDSFLDRWIPWDDFHVGANYARIESSVQLDPNQTTQTNAERPLQGQSPYVANLQLGYTDPDGGSEWTLLYNVFGERISQAGVQRQPDVYEQPFPQLDLVYRRGFGDQWDFKLRLKNLLDPEVEFTQGSEITRRYSKGREISLSIEFKPKW